MVVIVHCHHFHFIRRTGAWWLLEAKFVLVDETKSLCVADTNESLQGESHRTLKFYSRSSGVSNDLSLLMSINLLG